MARVHVTCACTRDARDGCQDANNKYCNNNAMEWDILIDFRDQWTNAWRRRRSLYLYRYSSMLPAIPWP